MTPTASNVVIIYADDLGWGDVGCFGGTEVHTPHLDALAADGVAATQWYSNSPVCSPSRAALLTGLHPAHAGVETILGAERHVVGLPDQPTLASRLRDAGVRTGAFGKWHLGVEDGSGPTRRGFEQHKGFRAGCVDYYSHIMYWGLKNPIHDLWDNDTEIWHNGDYLTDVITDWACDFIQRQNGRFLCYVPYNAPHYPMHAPEDAMARFAHLPWEKQVMAAMISRLDDGIGQIVAALKESGQYDNTVIVFSSDNGPSIEERNWLNGEEIAFPGGSAGGLRGHKGSLYEGGIRVPTVWTWPAGLPSNVVCTEPGQMMDVVPTVLEAMGTPVGKGKGRDTDGVSLLPVLRGERSAPDRVLCWEYDGQLAVRRDDWKLVRDVRESLGAPTRQGDQLFDLAVDPREERPVSGPHPMHDALGSAMSQWRADLDGWRAARV